MFRASPNSSQIDLFSNVEQFLRNPDQKKLNDPNAWQNVFLDQVTNRIPEERFAELFDDTTGRPNVPLRLLVGMLILKEGFGWSDEALFEAVHFNLRDALIERLLLEQYQVDDSGEAARVTLKPTKDIRADSLQSPHDEDAAYRKKRDETTRSYSVNLTEACQDDGLNLIVDVRVEPATAADNSYLQEAVTNSEQVLQTPADKDIHYTGFPGKPGRYDVERTEEYKPGRYRFRADGQWRYISGGCRPRHLAPGR